MTDDDFAPLFHLRPTDADPGASSWPPGVPVGPPPFSSLRPQGRSAPAFNAVINHTQRQTCCAEHGQSPPLKRGGGEGELWRTQRALCAGETQVIVRRDAPARWGDMRVDFVRVFSQPRPRFRKPHVCLISYFISWPG